MISHVVLSIDDRYIDKYRHDVRRLAEIIGMAALEQCIDHPVAQGGVVQDGGEVAAVTAHAPGRPISASQLDRGEDEGLMICVWGTADSIRFADLPEPLLHDILKGILQLQDYRNAEHVDSGSG